MHAALSSKANYLFCGSWFALQPCFFIGAVSQKNIIRFAITDLRQNRPVLSDITTDGPIGLRKDNVKKRTATSWSGTGATEVELLVFDSLTQDGFSL